MHVKHDSCSAWRSARLTFCECVLKIYFGRHLQLVFEKTQFIFHFFDLIDQGRRGSAAVARATRIRISSQEHLRKSKRMTNVFKISSVVVFQGNN